MKTKKIVLINDTIEYSISVKETGSNTIYKMKRSESDCWADSSKGEKVAKLKENGEEITISIGGEKIVLEYCDLWELHILLTEFFSDPIHGKFTILKSDI